MDWPAGRFQRTSLQPTDNPEMRHATMGIGTGSVTWPTANLALVLPLIVDVPTLVKRLWTSNGAAAAGNLDIGLYRYDLSLIVSSGTTAQSGTLGPQYLNIADTLLPVGRYYLALVMDGTTGTITRVATNQSQLRAVGAFQMASAFVLPDPLVPAALAQDIYPIIGCEVLRGQ